MLGAVGSTLASVNVHKNSTGKTEYESFQPTLVALGSYSMISFIAENTTWGLANNYSERLRFASMCSLFIPKQVLTKRFKVFVYILTPPCRIFISS